MKLVRLVLLLMGFSCFASPADAQLQAAPQLASSAVPRLVNFSGRVTDSRGKAVSGVSGITFSIYQDQQEGPPLWMETQNVESDSRGNYTVQLGGTKSEGLPLELFSRGEARWLGVRVQGQEEQPRVLLLSVPYALKAGDAATVGGLPPSAFVLAAPASSAGAGTAPNPSPSAVPPTSDLVTGTGSGGSLPMWDSTSDLTNSVLVQSGSGSSAKVGINTSTPSTTLDVKGSATVRGTLVLPSNGTANASAGKNSEPLSLAASAFNSTTGTAVKQDFLWQAEAAGNNSSSPSGSLNLLFGESSNKPAETGLQISSSGLFTFAPGQAFPGTIGEVTAGNDLVGGGSAGNITLSLDTSRVPELAAANIFSANQTVLGNVTSAGLVSGNQLVSTASTGIAPLNVTSTTQVPNLNASLLGGLAPSSFAELSVSNVFLTSQGIFTHGGLMVMGDMQCNTGFLGISFGPTGTCTNYSLLGDGKNTFINRPTGGTIFFRENNANQMTIGSLGLITVSSTVNKIASFQVTSSKGAGGQYTGGTDATNIGQPGLTATGGTDAGGTDTGGSGMVTTGGAETNTSDGKQHTGGTGLTATGGPASDTSGTGGEGIVATGGNHTVAGSFSTGGNGIFAMGGNGGSFSGDGILAFSGKPCSAIPGCQSALFGDEVGVEGNLDVDGTLTAAVKHFRIDHPIDPANKYLNHSSVESSEMLNIYSGNVTLNSGGTATVRLPDWFQAENGDFRYQLTAIGGPGPNLYIAQKVDGNQFQIAGGTPGMEVSWQITAVRQDAYAKAHPLVVEEEKPANLRGYYIHPSLFGQPEEKQIEWGSRPQLMRHIREMKENAGSRIRPAESAAGDAR